MKKLLTLTLSLLMAFSLCLTISAEDNSSNYFKIGDSEYPSLEAALYAVNSSTSSDETTIKLLAERTETGSGNGSSFSIDSGKNIVLDLNGNTLTLNNYSISCYGNLTIKDSSDAKEGQIIFVGANSSSNFRISVGNGATFTLQSGKIISQNNSFVSATIYVSALNGTASHVFIEGGSIESSGSVACIKAKNVDATAEVNGGTFKGSNIFVEENGGKIIVSSGTYSNDVSGYMASGYNIIKQTVGALDEFKVVKNTDQVTVDDETKALVALSSTDRSLLNYAGSTTNTIKDENNDNVSVNSSTQLVLEATKIANMAQDDIDKVVEKTGTEISKLSLLPLDITLTSINDGVSQKIAYLGDGVEMPVTLYLSDDVVSAFSGKTIKVVRFHDDDVPDVIPASLSDNVLTFTTGKFSTYVIAAYSDAKPTPSPTPTPTPSTSSETSSNESSTKVVTCEEAMGSKNWTWSESKKACVYKVTNTSAE